MKLFIDSFLTYPSLVTITYTFSLTIKSSALNDISSTSSLTSVLLSTPYSFLICLSSFLITAFNFSGLASISSNALIKFCNSFNLFCNSTISVLVNLYNCNLTIASACSGKKSNFFTKLASASALFLDALIVLITSSKIDIALTKPSTIIISFFKAAKSNSHLLLTTSLSNSMYASIIPTTPMILGLLFTIDTMLYEKLDCKSVFLNKYAMIKSLFAFGFKSITILTNASLSDSSLTSAIPDTLPDNLISSIFFTSCCLFTSKGISFIIICSLPFSLTNSYLALTITLPRPVVKACLIASLPSITPPVGKSGPLTISKIESK